MSVILIHTDASVRADHAGIGVAAYVNGALVASLAKPAGECPCTQAAECRAVFEGLRLARTLNAREVVLCTDEQGVVEMLSQPERPERRFWWDWWSEYQQFREHFEACTLVWIRREKNELAHALSIVGRAWVGEPKV